MLIEEINLTDHRLRCNYCGEKAEIKVNDDCYCDECVNALYALLKMWVEELE